MKRRKSNISIGSFNTSYHYEMLIDERRVEPYKTAIQKNVQNDSIVLDIGTGSGLLAILAARSGAKTVYAVERMKDMQRIANANFVTEDNQALNTPVIAGDATKRLALNETVDVLLCELLSTWLVTEQQASVCRNIRPLLKDSASIIPQKMKNYITGVIAPIDFFGIRIGHPYYIRELRNSRPFRMTSTELSHVIDFRTIDNMNVKIDGIELTCHTGGIINAVVLESDAELDDEVVVGDSQTLFLPYVVPLEEDVKVSIGHKVTAKISYEYGGNWNNFTVSLVNNSCL